MPFEVMPEAELRLHLLGIFWRVAQVRDRRGDVKVDTHHGTGLPQSATDLLSRSTCPYGKKLAMELCVRPEEVPMALGRRVDPKDSSKTISLKYIPRAQWTAVEEEWVQDLELQVKALVHKLTETWGYFVLRPAGGNPYDPEEPLCFGEDGMTQAFRITWAGLKAAFEEIPGTRFAELRTLEADVGTDLHSATPDWHKEEPS